MAVHRGVCEQEEVGCPCPGCEERMARVEVEEHVEESGAEHVPMAWGRAAEMEEKVAAQAEVMKEQGKTIILLEASRAEHQREDALHEGRIARLKGKVKEQHSVIAGLQRQALALTRVFTWSTDRAWKFASSEKYTFTGGVRGYCFNTPPDADDAEHFMGFTLQERPSGTSSACKMQYTCSILNTDDTVFP